MPWCSRSWVEIDEDRSEHSRAGRQTSGWAFGFHPVRRDMMTCRRFPGIQGWSPFRERFSVATQLHLQFDATTWGWATCAGLLVPSGYGLLSGKTGRHVAIALAALAPSPTPVITLPVLSLLIITLTSFDLAVPPTGGPARASKPRGFVTRSGERSST